MNDDSRVRELGRHGWASVSNVPIVVLGIALVCWAFASNGVYVDGDWGAGVMWNPVNYALSMVLHFDWGHFESNMWWWLPLGVLFTLLTSNRHVLLVAVVSHLLTQIVSNGLFRFVSGLSVVVFAVLAAILVQSIAISFQNQSMEALQNALALLLVPALLGVFLVVVIVGPSHVGHLEHFLGALFGAGIELVYVLDAQDTDTDGPDPERRSVVSR